MATSTPITRLTVQDLTPSFERSLRAENKSPRTVRKYIDSAVAFAQFLADMGVPQAVEDVRREHIETWIESLLARWKPATALTYYQSIRAYFKWCVSEGEIKTHPMEHMSPPRLPETAPPVLTDDDLHRLLRACQGTTFEDRRDLAIVRLFLDTGCRRAELAQLRIDDIDWTVNVVRVVGKGNRERAAAFGRKAAQALDRYLRARARHRDSNSEWFWLGHAGPMSRDGSGLAQAVERRAQKAGVEDKIHLHKFRHKFAHEWLRQGGQETDLMQLAGWRSRTMVSRYAASAAADRAREAHQRFGPGDRL